MNQRRVPDLVIEKLALGELTPAEARAVEERLAAEGEGAAERRLAALRDDDAAILAAHPPARAAAVIERRLADARARRRPRLWLAAPLVAAAALLLWVRLGDDGAGPIDPTRASAGADADADAIRLKGQEPHLVLHRRGAGAPERLAEGAAVAPGDVLQVSYVAAGRRRGVVLSIDGRGVVTLHHPDREGAAADLVQEGAVPLDHAYELDDAPDFERFVFVTAAAPGAHLDVGEVLAAARAVAGGPSASRAPLALAAGLEERSFLVQKTGRPR